MADRGRPRGFDRAAALRRAMEVFWEHGYEGTSIADLTAAMGVRPPSLYAAFGSKEALFIEGFALYGATEGEQLWGPVAEAPTARAADGPRQARRLGAAHARLRLSSFRKGQTARLVGPYASIEVTPDALPAVRA